MGLPDLAADLGIAEQVSFHPPVDRATLADWYRAADAVLIPSHSESFGLVAVEAQACGGFVAASDVGGLPVAVGSAGLLLPVGDVGAWADALESVLTDAAGAPARSRAAVMHAAGFGWERTAARLAEVYEFAIAGPLRSSINEADTLVGIPAAVIP